MRIIRCHVDLPLRPSEHLRLPADTSQHLLRVLRLSVGDLVTLFNGDGLDYVARILGAARSAAEVEILESVEVSNESPLQVWLGQALARGDKMDWVAQKCTELGLQRLSPLVTVRSEVRLNAERAQRRVAHWKGVLAAACEQSGRARLPQIDAPQPLAEWCTAAGAGWYLDPDGENSLADLGEQASQTMLKLAIGPEGGWDPRDIDIMRDAGFRGLRVGPRVLRTETAGAAVLAALQALYGDWR